MAARVKRSNGPKGTLTKRNCRRKALPFLLADFQNRCAYCIQHGAMMRDLEMHLEHFDAHATGKARERYSNYMLACGACNLTKLAKYTVNPFDRRQRLLNCTVENEFPGHIFEDEDGHWRN